MIEEVYLYACHPLYSDHHVCDESRERLSFINPMYSELSMEMFVVCECDACTRGKCNDTDVNSDVT